MKIDKLFLMLVALVLFSTDAFAEITPNDVAEKMKSGDIKTAEMLTREILKEHPDSAKAHYYLGQILGIEGEYKDAYSELKKAASLDKSLSFAASPDKFREEMAKVEMNTGRAAAPPISNTKESHFSWGWMILLVIFGGFISWFLSKPKKTFDKRYTPSAPPTGNKFSDNTSRPSPTPSAAPPVYPEAQRTNYQNAPAQAAAYHPSHVVNNYSSSGNNDGLVTGLILGEMMSAHQNGNTVIDRETVVERDTTTNNNFDSGTDDTAIDNDFDSGSNDSVDTGSSDFDSGSSDSSFDSGSDSSFDSGGDSGGSSW